MHIPYFERGQGSDLHFLHANGYPPECYEPFLKLLGKNYHVLGMYLRPLWPGSDPDEIRDWNPFSEDLLQFLGEHNLGPVIGVGHSIGAVVTLRAALKESDRFRALLLMEPVLFPRYFMLEWNLARVLGLRNRIHPKIASSLHRRREFDDLEKVFAGYRRREVFRFFSNENLRAYIKGMTRPKADGGHELAFSPEWETRIYYTSIWRDWDLWSGLSKLEIPTLIIRGAETDTFWESTARTVHKKNPRIETVTLENATHLLPLERPEEIFEVIQSFLKEVL